MYQNKVNKKSMDLDVPLSDSGRYGDWNIAQIFHHTNLKQMHRMASKCHRQLRSTASRFRVTGHFETSALNDRKVKVFPYTCRWQDGLRYTICELIASPNPSLHPVFHGQPFTSYRPHRDNCTEWPQNDKLTLITWSNVRYICITSAIGYQNWTPHSFVST